MPKKSEFIRLILFLAFTLILICQLFQNHVEASSISEEQIRGLIRDEIRNFFIESTNSSSPPSFAFQTSALNDSSDDWIWSSNYAENRYNNSVKPPDITAVSFSSDVSNLNITIWFSPTLIRNQSASPIVTNFGVLVSPQQGISYLKSLSLNESAEFPAEESFIESAFNRSRTLEWQSYSTVPIQIQHGRVDFTIPLDDLLFVSGSHYQVMAFTGVFFPNILHFASDYTRSTVIPPPKFDLIMSPVKVRQGEIEVTEARIKSNVNFDSVVTLSAIVPNGIDVNLNPHRLSIAPGATEVSVLQVRASNQATANLTHSIPITMGITFAPTFNTSGFKKFVEFAPEGEQIGTASSEHNLSASVLPALPPVQISIPEEYLLPLYGLIFSFLVPGIVKMINAKRQRGYVSRYRKRIDDTFSRLHDKSDERLQAFERIKSLLIEEYEKGRLSETHYQMLIERISDFTRKLDQK